MPVPDPAAHELETLRHEALQLREHIEVVERGSDLGRRLVIEQFREVDRVLTLLQAENALRKSLLDATDQLSIIAADGEGRVTLFNRGAENMLGYLADQVVARAGLFDFHDPAEIADIERLTGRRGIHALIELAQNNAVRGREWSYLDKRARRIPVSLSISPVRDGAGRIGGIVCSAMDISELKAKEEALRSSEARYRELSVTDNLSGLYNARHFHAQILAEVERAHRYARPLAMLMIDVDNFKSYNDSYGHPEGDRVLASLGALLHACLRPTDSGYRYGGEEFVALLPETPLHEALAVAERLRARFVATQFEARPGHFASRSLSVGCAALAAQEQAAGLIRRADAAAYEAKRGGKNRVVAAA